MDAPLAKLEKQFAGLKPRASGDLPSCTVCVDQLIDVLRYSRDVLGFDMLMDVTAIDWDQDSPRFEVIYHCFSTTSHQYLRIAVACPEDEEPEVPSACEIWPAANWHERETYDMFGIRFSGHPDLRRILMWEDYPHYPLRKEFPLAGIETEFPGEDVASETEVKVTAAPMMGGPFHAPQKSFMSEREPRALDQSWSEANPRPGGEENN